MVVKVKLNTHSMIWLQIYLLICVRLISNIVSNNVIVYLCDIVTIAILVFSLLKSKVRVSRMAVFFIAEAAFWLCSFLFGVSGSISAFINLFRIFVRFYIVFLACCGEMNDDDYIKLFKVFDFIIFVHFALVMFQIFVLHETNGDAVGGIFGIVFGYGNGASHALILFSTLITLYKYFTEMETIKFSLVKIAMSFTIAMLTEMKSFVFEALIILLMFMLFNRKFKIRTMIIIVMIPIAGILFAKYIGSNFNFDIFSMNSINSYLDNGYGFNIDGIGRNDGYQKVFDACFNGDITKTIFGFGFATSASDFTAEHFGNMNLGNFTYAKIFYDMGIVGTILYFIPFILCIIQGIRIRKKALNLSIFSILLGIFGIYYSFYGSLMESDFSGYFYYILMSIPFVMCNRLKNNKPVQDFSIQKQPLKQ